MLKKQRKIVFIVSYFIINKRKFRFSEYFALRLFIFTAIYKHTENNILHYLYLS